MSHGKTSGTHSSCKTDARVGYWVIQRKSKDAQETASCLRRFLLSFQKPGRFHTDNSKESIGACQDLQWTHVKNAPHRSDANKQDHRKSCSKWSPRWVVAPRDGMFELRAERARQDGRWQDSIRQKMWCNISPTFDPVRSQSQLQTHLLKRRVATASTRLKMLPGVFMGYVLRAGGGWSGDLGIADCRDLENVLASESHVQRF